MEVKAHLAPVDSLSFSEERGTLFSCCEQTRIVRLWNPFSMDLEGILNQTTLA